MPAIAKLTSLSLLAVVMAVGTAASAASPGASASANCKPSLFSPPAAPGYASTTWPTEHADAWRTHAAPTGLSRNVGRLRLKTATATLPPVPVWGYVGKGDNVYLMGGAPYLLDMYTELMQGADDHKWDEPVFVCNVARLNTNNAELCPVVYKDGIVFTSNRKTPGRNKIYGWTGANYLDLYYAKKGTDDLSYTDVAPFAGTNILGRYNDGPACFSKNFDTIYISRVDRDLRGTEKKNLKIERNKIFRSVMKDGKWTNAVAFTLNNDIFSVANPYLTTDGSRIYFVSDMPGGYGETDIYYCNRDGDGWSKPVNMGPNVNTFNREKYPAMDAAGNFYFSSDGYQGFGGLDICVALNKNGSFAKAIPLKYPVNSSADDFGIVFLKDGKTGYITSNRGGGRQGDDIFYFDLTDGKVNKGLSIFVYTIGYRPETHPVLVATAIIIHDHPPVIAEAAAPVDMHIYFDFDKRDIRPDAIIHIDSVINYMNESKNLELLVGGHCDSRGTSGYNMNLSVLRCNAALQYLSNKGISLNRMTATGYGFNQLVNHCEKGVDCTAEEHQLNRSVYFHFEGKKIADVNTDKMH